MSQKIGGGSFSIASRETENQFSQLFSIFDSWNFYAQYTIPTNKNLQIKSLLIKRAVYSSMVCSLKTISISIFLLEHDSNTTPNFGNNMTAYVYLLPILLPTFVLSAITLYPWYSSEISLRDRKSIFMIIYLFYDFCFRSAHKC